MAIAFDAAASSQAAGGSSSLTFSHTCSTGDDRILWVAVATGNNSPTVTYAGVSMTEAGTDNEGGYYQNLFYLVAPATGANNVVITLGSGTNGIIGASASYTGASQTGVPDATNVGSQTSADPLAVSVTTIADNCWVVGGFTGSVNTAPIAGADTTVRAANNNALPIQGAIADSAAVVTPAGSRTLSVNPQSNSFSSLVVASFAPATGGGGGDDPNLGRLTLLGVGL